MSTSSSLMRATPRVDVVVADESHALSPFVKFFQIRRTRKSKRSDVLARKIQNLYMKTKLSLAFVFRSDRPKLSRLQYLYSRFSGNRGQNRDG